MSKISINLLPPEILDEDKIKGKQPLFTKISISLLILIVALTVAVFMYGISQSLALKNLENQVDQASLKVTTLKEQEGLLTLLKARIDKIKSLAGQESPPAQAFNMISGVMPAEMKLLSFSMDKNSRIILSGETSTTVSIKSFFDSLMDTGKSGGVSSVKVESLSRSMDGKIRFDLTIVSNTGAKQSQQKKG